MGALFQGNLGSFSGFYGADVQKIAEQLRADGVCDHFGSDAHTVAQVRKF